MEVPRYLDDGVPLNEAAFLADQWADMTCCEKCRGAFQNHFDTGLPTGIQWCFQCQRYECPEHQHEEI